MYQEQLELKLKQLDSSKTVPTCDLNYRIIYGYDNELQDLALFLNYMKRNKQCNISTDYNNRIAPDQNIAGFNRDNELNSSIIIVNKENINDVVFRCQTNGFTSNYLVLKRQHIDQLFKMKFDQNILQHSSNINSQQQQSQTQSWGMILKEYFNKYDLFICPHQLAKDLKIILQDNYELKQIQDEQDAIINIIKLLKQKDNTNMTDDEFTTQMNIVSKPLEFYKKTQLIDQKWGLNRLQNRFVRFQTGFYFQRSIYLQEYSSKCQKTIPAKCHYLIIYQQQSTIWLKEISEAHIKARCFVENKTQWNQEVILETQTIQFKEYIDKIKQQIIIQNSQQYFKYCGSYVNVKKEIPIQAKDNRETVIDQILKMPFKVYSTQNESFVQNAIETFDKFNKTCKIPDQVIKNYKPDQIRSIVNKRLTEDCIICMCSFDNSFVFGCCGCVVSTECMFNLIDFKRVKCPNCRFLIKDTNSQLGCFLLSNIYEQYMKKNESLYNNIEQKTIFINGCLNKEAELSNYKEIIIDFSVNTFTYDLNQLYKYISTIPDDINVSFNLYAPEITFLYKIINQLTF